MTYQTYRPSAPKQKKRKSKAVVFVFAIAIITCVSLALLNGQPSKATGSKTVAATHASTTATVAAPSPQATTATPPAAPAAGVDTTVSDQLKAAWQSIATTRVGDVDIALYNNKTGQTTHYTDAAGTLNTASIVKLSIAEEVLIQAQQQGIPLTSSQQTNLQNMIENSDNTSASTLWSQVGGATAMDNFFSSVGASSTVAGTDGFWGLTQTTSMDQLAVINAVAYPSRLLNASSTAIITNLINNVEADQDWGISGGIGANATYGLKNGWLEDNETSDAYAATDSWTVNSVGHVQDPGNNVDYTIAVLTDGQTDEQYGIDTIESLSTASWNILSQ